MWLSARQVKVANVINHMEFTNVISHLSVTNSSKFDHIGDCNQPCGIHKRMSHLSLTNWGEQGFDMATHLWTLHWRLWLGLRFIEFVILRWLVEFVNSTWLMTLATLTCLTLNHMIHRVRDTQMTDYVRELHMIDNIGDFDLPYTTWRRTRFIVTAWSKGEWYSHDSLCSCNTDDSLSSRVRDIT